jgi:hypothetical protein
MLNIMWHVDPLLGKDGEMTKYTTAVTRQRPVKRNRERCFLCDPCRDVMSRTSEMLIGESVSQSVSEESIGD